MLLVSVAPYQMMNLRGTQAGALSLAITGHLAFQNFTMVGGIGKAFEQGSTIATLSIICITIIPLMLLALSGLSWQVFAPHCGFKGTVK